MTLTVISPLTITTNSPLPSAVQGSPYSQTLAAAGGLPPYSWSVTTGSLPAGLALAPSTGVLSGSPSTSGSFNFTVQVSDSRQPTPLSATKAFSLTVISPLTITTNSPLPSAVQGSPYSRTLAATGGLPPYSWSVTTGSLPAGLALAPSTGVLSGNPSTSGSFNFTVQVSDSRQPTPLSTTKAFSLTVISPLTITTNSPLPSAVQESSYSQTLAAAGGLPPYSWSVTSGSLPAGLALAPSTGVLSGSPSTSGSFNFTVQVSDSSQPTPLSATKAFSLVVSAAAPVLTSISPSSAAAGGPAFTLTVNGSNFVSNSTVRWNGSNRTTTFVSSSQLTAAIPATNIASPGTAAVTVANPGGSISNALTFTVSPAALTITTASPLPGGVVGVAYSQTLSATGGQPPYSWSVVAGSPPAGLALTPSSGILSGTPSAEGTINFTVQVSDGAQPTPQTTTKIFSLTVTAAPAPVLNSINPSAANAGGPAFTLTVNGSNFVSNSTVRWNGVNRATTFVSGSQLTAAIPATDIATAGTASVTVVNPGGTALNALTFTISASNVLTITTGSPLPQGTVASAYSQTLAASGGTPTLLLVHQCRFASSRAQSERFDRSH